MSNAWPPIPETGAHHRSQLNSCRTGASLQRCYSGPMSGTVANANTHSTLVESSWSTPVLPVQVSLDGERTATGAKHDAAPEKEQKEVLIEPWKSKSASIISSGISSHIFREHVRCNICGHVFTGHGSKRRVQSLFHIVGGVVSTLAFTYRDNHRFGILGSRWMGTYAHLRHTRIIFDVACLAVYTVSSTFFYREHEGDRYQDRCLIGGIGIGMFITLAAGLSLEQAVIYALPWCILVSLLLSSIYHAYLRIQEVDSGATAKRGCFCLEQS